MKKEEVSPRVVAVVTTYRPDKTIFETLDAISRVCAYVIVVDDGSPGEFDGILDQITPVISAIIRQPENLGLAEALNVGSREAVSRFRADFIVTFDQDTTPAADYISRAIETYECATEAGLQVALVCAGRVNQWGLDDVREKSGFIVANEAIQSGFVIPASSFAALGEFRSSYFIDCVDIEYMIRAQTRGFHSVVSGQAQILHTVGERIAVKIWERQIHVFGKRLEFSYHGPLRRYYITRNRYLLFKAYGTANPRWAIRHLVTEAKIAFLCLVFGANRRNQVFAFFAGLLDAIRGREGKIPPLVAKYISSPSA